jgi:16S rRNA (cytosine1402-N4)-methyltransferase
MSKFSHIPVLLAEVLEGLDVTEGKSYIDATAGGGGHTQEIVNRGGKVFAIDQDTDALSHLETRFADEKKVTIIKGNFGDIKEIVHQQKPMASVEGGQAHLHGFGEVSGILFDLGMSSFQIDSSSRGFSFHRDQPLDMRMDPEKELTAYEVVNKWSPHALEEVLLKYGEEHQASQVVDAIVASRRAKKIETTGELVQIIKKVIRRNEKIHPSTRVFQAIRIAVNAELDVLKTGLSGALDIVGSGGKIVVISFHSLEDRIVKNAFREFEKNDWGIVNNKKPITATEEEKEINPRSRSAKMRIFIKK